MPYKSDAQRKFFHSAGAKKVGITQVMVSEYDQASKGMNLPKRAKKMVRHSPLMLQVDCSKLHTTMKTVSVGKC